MSAVGHDSVKWMRMVSVLGRCRHRRDKQKCGRVSLGPKRYNENFTCYRGNRIVHSEIASLPTWPAICCVVFHVL